MPLQNSVQVIQLRKEASFQKVNPQEAVQLELPGMNGPSEAPVATDNRPNGCDGCSYWDFHNAHLCQMCRCRSVH